MKVVLTGGGTGGHIYPAIAIGDKIKRKQKEADLLFVGTERGMEKTLVPNNGYPIRFIKARGFDRKHLLNNLATFRDFINGSREAKSILEEYQPDLVIGTGGYVSLPVLRAAHQLGIKTYLHEQNALPGLANRLLERYVEKVFLSFPESAKYFKMKEKLVVTGNPLRKSFLVSGITDYREKLHLDEKDFVLLCFGGSRGAEQINQVMTEAIPYLAGVPNIKVFFITGTLLYQEIVERLQQLKIGIEGSITVLPYAENLHEYLLASDLVISRSGALTISELTACGKPSILIPSPNVTGNHQYYNAKVVADKGGAILIQESELDGDKLIGTIMRLRNNPNQLNSMAKASESLGRLDSADVIYDYLGLS